QVLRGTPHFVRRHFEEPLVIVTRRLSWRDGQLCFRRLRALPFGDDVVFTHELQDQIPARDCAVSTADRSEITWPLDPAREQRGFLSVDVRSIMAEIQLGCLAKPVNRYSVSRSYIHSVDVLLENRGLRELGLDDRGECDFVELARPGLFRTQ